MSADTAASDAALLERFPGVRIDHDNKAYYRGLLGQRLLVNRCDACGRRHHPPKPACPHCWSWSVTPTAVAGTGAIHFFSFLNGTPAPDSPGAPFAVVVVQLDEGVRFTTTIVDCDKADIATGLSVELAWIERDGMPFPAVRPRRAGA